MFIQVIQGRVSDRDGLRRQIERWNEEIRPGADGFLGSTSGVTTLGQAIMIARFESADAAVRNSQRDEQTAWWNETSKYFDGAEFHDCTDIETEFGGGDDSAGFVQIMHGRCTDRARLEEIEAELLPQLREARPEILGIVRAWHSDDPSAYTQAIYFRSEEAAREGEATAPPDDVADRLSEWDQLTGEVTYLDLTDPWLI